MLELLGCLESRVNRKIILLSKTDSMKLFIRGCVDPFCLLDH